MDNCLKYSQKGTNTGKLHKITLYHATTAKNDICKDGFKPLSQLKGKRGLGGNVGHDETAFSFTYDPEIAVGLSKDFQTMAKIARKDVTIENMGEFLNKQDGDSCKSNVKPPAIWNYILQGRPDIVEMYKKGYYHQCSPLDDLTLDQWEKQAGGEALPSGNSQPAFDAKSGKPIGYAYRCAFIKNPELQPETLFTLYKMYLRERESDFTKCRVDPFFHSSTSIKQFANIDNKDIGVISVDVISPMSEQDLDNQLYIGNRPGRLGNTLEWRDNHLLWHKTNGELEQGDSFLKEIRASKNRFIGKLQIFK